MPLAYGSQIIWLDGYSPITNKKRQPEDRLIKVKQIMDQEPYSSPLKSAFVRLSVTNSVCG